MSPCIDFLLCSVPSPAKRKSLICSFALSKSNISSLTGAIYEPPNVPMNFLIFSIDFELLFITISDGANLAISFAK